jgi:hypothetical protein
MTTGIVGFSFTVGVKPQGLETCGSLNDRIVLSASDGGRLVAIIVVAYSLRNTDAPDVYKYEDRARV